MTTLSDYVRPQFEYCVLIEIAGVVTANMQSPPNISCQGETIESTTPVEALNELGAKGWAVHTTTAAPFGDAKDSMMVFIILGRPLTNA
jgi:hypothetical protein